MSESSPRRSLTLIHDKRRDFLVSGISVAIVIAVSVVAIWQLHSSALSKIDEMTALSDPESDESAAEIGDAARVDPVGFNLANYMQAHYGTVVIVIYGLLGALCIAAVARFIVFLMKSFDRRRFYPDIQNLTIFLTGRMTTWEDFSSTVMAQDHLRSRFWRILKDSVKVTESSGRYDHLYLHLRNRIDRITEYMNETSLYESIATASPAAGFFGTLVGLLFIFSNSPGGMSSLSESPAFSVGMKVAIITSLWGLFNLGIAIIFGYFTKRISEGIHEQMIVRGVIVCEAAESVSAQQGLSDSEHLEEAENLAESAKPISKESIRV
jgi:biopolymer transport protein ExbB/TolQ